METSWTTQFNNLRLRTAVRSGIDERVEQTVGNSNKTINGVSPTNGWTNRTNESGDRTVSPTLYFT